MFGWLGFFPLFFNAAVRGSLAHTAELKFSCCVWSLNTNTVIKNYDLPVKLEN